MFPCSVSHERGRYQAADDELIITPSNQETQTLTRPQTEPEMYFNPTGFHTNELKLVDETSFMKSYVKLVKFQNKPTSQSLKDKLTD